MRKSRLFITVSVLAVFSLSLLGRAQDFKDVPAGHWAKQAVEYITQCGLLEGFPDGTYRGNQNLTRYQAALIFFRLLQSNTKCPLPTTQGQQAMTQGMDEVKKELDDIKKAYADLEKKITDQDARMAALEDKVKQMSATAQAVADLQKRLADLEAAVKALPSGAQPQDNSALLARITALEDQLKKVTTGNLAGAYSLSAGTELEKKIAVLEEQVRTLAARPSPADQSSQIAVLQEQVKTLTSTVQAQQAEINALKQQPTPQPQTQTQPEPQAQPQPVTPTAAPRPTNFYIGAGVGTAILPSTGFSTSNLNISGFVGLKSLFFNIGPRVGVDYNLGSGALAVEANLITNTNPLYFGLGARFLPATSTVLGNGVVGFNLNFNNNLGLFVEANPRLELGLQFGLGARAGLKLSF